MNARQSTLLNHLLYLDHYTPVCELARVIGCSERTVRTDTKVVNDYLAHAGFTSHIYGKRGNGIRIALTRGEQGRLEAMVADTSIEMKPRLERFYRGILLLVCSPKAYTIDSLAHGLFTNKQQLHLDMKWWSFMLESFQLSIDKKGPVSIKGPEIALRFFIVYFFYQLDRRMMQSRIEPAFMKNETQFLQAVADEAEKELGLQLSKNSRQQTSFYLKLMCERIRLGHPLAEQPVCDPTHPLLCERLRARFERHLGMPINDHEAALASNMFSCGTWQWSSRSIEEYEPSSDAVKYTKRIESALEGRFGQAPDDSLHGRLLVLVDGALLRRASKLSIPGPIEHVVKHENMDAFLLLSEVLYNAPELRDFEVMGADYTRIIMALFEYLDHVNTERIFRVGLVVNAGVEQAAYGKYRIEKLASKIRIVETVTENDVERPHPSAVPLAERFDFLISFEPLTSSFPTITLSEAINEQDIVRLMTSIPLLDNNLETQLRCIDAEIILHAADLEHMMRSMYEELVRTGALFMKIKQFARTLESSYFVNGATLVLPVFGDGVGTTCAVFFRAHDFNLFGKLIETVAVLLVSEVDRSTVSSLTEQFKRILAEREGFEDKLMAYFST